jgi:hypothetical protein
LFPCEISSASREIIYSVGAPRLNLLAAMRNFPLSVAGIIGSLKSKQPEKIFSIKKLIGESTRKEQSCKPTRIMLSKDAFGKLF